MPENTEQKIPQPQRGKTRQRSPQQKDTPQTVPRQQQQRGKPKKQKPKRSAFDHVINLICIGILTAMLFNEYAHLNKPEAPMEEYTAFY